MSYTSGCTFYRANFFANPNVSYLGKPTGTATENCARAIEENKVGKQAAVGTMHSPNISGAARRWAAVLFAINVIFMCARRGALLYLPFESSLCTLPPAGKEG